MNNLMKIEMYRSNMYWKRVSIKNKTILKFNGKKKYKEKKINDYIKKFNVLKFSIHFFFLNCKNSIYILYLPDF